jgi:hypothetical protein
MPVYLAEDVSIFKFCKIERDSALRIQPFEGENDVQLIGFIIPEGLSDVGIGPADSRR